VGAEQLDGRVMAIDFDDLKILVKQGALDRSPGAAEAPEKVVRLSETPSSRWSERPDAPLVGAFLPVSRLSAK